MTDSNNYQVVITDLGIGESPRWRDGRLWFSNWGNQEIIAIDTEGKSEIMVHLPFKTFPFSIDWLPDGRLLIVSTSDTPLLVQETDGSLQPYADLSDLGIRGWNEIVIDSRGNTYINGGNSNPLAGEKYTPGFIAIVMPDGSSRRVADNIAFPNGMAVTPDNKTLIIAESYALQLTAFDIEPNGDLTNRRVWAKLGENENPDGLAIDAEGAVWYATVPGKHCVRVREGGEILDTVDVGLGCFACALGDKENQKLFIMVAEWKSMKDVSNTLPVGRVVAVPVSVPGVEKSSAENV